MFIQTIRRPVSALVSEVTEQVTEQVGRLLHALADEASSGNEIMLRLGLSHRPTFLYTYLQPALKAGLIEMTIPDKPQSSKQRYRLTPTGKAWVDTHMRGDCEDVD